MSSQSGRKRDQSALGPQSAFFPTFKRFKTERKPTTRPEQEGHDVSIGAEAGPGPATAQFPSSSPTLVGSQTDSSSESLRPTSSQDSSSAVSSNDTHSLVGREIDRQLPNPFTRALPGLSSDSSSSDADVSSPNGVLRQHFNHPSRGTSGLWEETESESSSSVSSSSSSSSSSAPSLPASEATSSSRPSISLTTSSAALPLDRHPTSPTSSGYSPSLPDRYPSLPTSPGHSLSLPDRPPTSSTSSGRGDDISSSDFDYNPDSFNPPSHTFLQPPLTAHNLSALQSRLTTFLPALHAANQALEQERVEGTLADRDIENVQGEAYIEMDLGLGVLEHRSQEIHTHPHNNETQSDPASSAAPDDPSPGGDSEIMHTLMGHSRAVREQERTNPGIEILL